MNKLLVNLKIARIFLAQWEQEGNKGMVAIKKQEIQDLKDQVQKKLAEISYKG